MRGRPHTIQPLVQSINESTPGARIVFIATEHDDEVLGALSGFKTLVMQRANVGDYAKKINFGYHATKEPLLFTGACDIKFHPGWFEAAVAELSPSVHVVGTNDLGHGDTMTGQHSTHTLVTRFYADNFGTIDERGKILHEGYIHEHTDNELVETAQARGMYSWSYDAKVEHLHPAWGKAKWDTMYHQNNERMAQSSVLFEERRKLWTTGQ